MLIGLTRTVNYGPSHTKQPQLSYKYFCGRKRFPWFSYYHVSRGCLTYVEHRRLKQGTLVKMSNTSQICEYRHDTQKSVLKHWTKIAAQLFWRRCRSILKFVPLRCAGVRRGFFGFRLVISLLSAPTSSPAGIGEPGCHEIHDWWPGFSYGGSMDKFLTLKSGEKTKQWVSSTPWSGRHFPVTLYFTLEFHSLMLLPDLDLIRLVIYWWKHIYFLIGPMIPIRMNKVS